MRGERTRALRAGSSGALTPHDPSPAPCALSGAGLRVYNKTPDWLPVSTVPSEREASATTRLPIGQGRLTVAVHLPAGDRGLRPLRMLPSPARLRGAVAAGVQRGVKVVPAGPWPRVGSRGRPPPAGSLRGPGDAPANQPRPAGSGQVRTVPGCAADAAPGGRIAHRCPPGPGDGP